jgi:hypothetical protein
LNDIFVHGFTSLVRTSDGLVGISDGLVGISDGYRCHP